MNERIKELLLQAGFENAYTDPQDGFEMVFVDEDHTTESVAKFAELIVRECARVANDSNQLKNRPVGVSVGDVVLKNFGVEW